MTSSNVLSLNDQELESRVPILNMTQFENLLKLTTKTITVPLLVLGAPGIGKSASIRALAQSLGSTLLGFADPNFGKELFGYLDFRLGYFDPTDLKGFPLLNPEEGFSGWLSSGFLPTVKNIEAGRVPANGICCLEELGLANDEVRKNAFQIIQEREINGEKIGEGWTFLATSNRHKDKSGATAMAAALINRFAVIELQPTVEDFTCYGRTAGIWSPIMAFFKFRPGLLHSFDPKNWKLNTPFCSPRSVENMSKQIQTWIESEKPQGKTPIPPGYIVKPNIGVSAAAEFIAYLSVYENIPDPDEVIANPKKAIIPEKPCELWALTTALTDRITNDNLSDVYPNVDAYLQRCPPDFEVASQREIASLTSGEVCAEPAWIDHTQRHEDIYAALQA